MKDGLRIHGTFDFRRFRFGVLMEERTVPNLIVDSGYAAVAGLIIQTGSTAPMAYLAIGTSTAAAASSDTTLYAECTTGGGQRALATLSRVTSDVANDTARLVKTFSFTTTSGYNISEAGVFNAVTTSSGTMLCRQIFVPISVINADTLEITYNLDID